MIKIKYFLLLFICCYSFSLKIYGQSPYISQNFNTPSFFNPATVGFGTYNKVQSFYRNQFQGVGNPYKTIGLGADFGFLKNEKTEPNNLGFGLQGVSEQVLDGILQTNSLTGSIANRIFFDDDKKTFLSLGLGATFIFRTIDYSALLFGDQFSQGRLVNAATMEALNNFQVKSTTNAGVLFSTISDNSHFQMGSSIYFLNRVTGAAGDSLANKNEYYHVSGQMNFEKIFNENKTIFIHANYQNRNENTFFYVGGAIGIPFNSSVDEVKRLYVGCFYRSKDAVVPYFGLMMNKFKFGLTYDIYNNDMTAANLKPQTLELTLTTFFGKRKAEGFWSFFD